MSVIHFIFKGCEVWRTEEVDSDRQTAVSIILVLYYKLFYLVIEYNLMIVLIFFKYNIKSLKFKKN